MEERQAKPPWIRMKIPSGENFSKIKKMVDGLQLATVCQEAKCPNLGECWGETGTATFMIMGDICTRGCRFCHVQSGHPKPLDPLEPSKVARAVAHLGLKYAVITSVDRDDLPDQGAGHFAATVVAVRQRCPSTQIEVLTPDFQGERNHLRSITEARPDVFGHNIETVQRITPLVRDRRASYRQSLEVLKVVKELDPAVITKSSIMVGLGETEEEILETLRDLRSVGCEVVTLGQYLRPSSWHLPVVRFLEPAEFKEWEEKARQLGFLFVASGPMVRSSYRASELFLQKTSLAKNRRDQNFASKSLV